MKSSENISRSFTPRQARANAEPAAVLSKAATEGRFEGEGWRVRKDGTRFWANVVIDAIKDEDDELIGFTKITRDITERRALEQAKEQLYQAQKMETVGQLTGGVAHDFNNLLTAVSGSHALLRQMVSDPRAQKLLDTAERAVARGAKLTQQLLAFSRQHRLQPEKANANELITAFEALLHHATGENIDVRLNLDPRTVGIEHRPDAVPVSAVEPDRQCSRRDGGDRGHDHDRDPELRDRSRSRPVAGRDPGRVLCHDRGSRRWRRDDARGQGKGRSNHSTQPSSPAREAALV